MKSYKLLLLFLMFIVLSGFAIGETRSVVVNAGEGLDVSSNTVLSYNNALTDFRFTDYLNETNGTLHIYSTNVHRFKVDINASECALWNGVGGQDIFDPINHQDDFCFNDDGRSTFFNITDKTNISKLVLQYDYDIVSITNENFYSYVTFNTSSNYVFPDEMGNSPFTMTTTNSITTVGGVFGNALRFKSASGGNFNNVFVSKNLSVLKNTSVSVGMWFKWSGMGRTLSSGISQTTGVGSKYEIHAFADLRFMDFSPITYDNSNYHFYVIVFDKNASTIKLYKDNVLLETKTSTENPFIPNVINPYILIGATQGISSYTDYTYIDDFFIYNGTMEKTDINYIMNNGYKGVQDLLKAPSQLTISNPHNDTTLNIIGQPINFLYSQSLGIQPVFYDVYLTNGVLNFPIKINTTLTTFNALLSKSIIPLSDDYNIKIIATNEYGVSVSLSDHKVKMCINEWLDNSTTCVDDTQIKHYYDGNNCSEEYDRPTDENTIGVCDDGIISSDEQTKEDLRIKKENSYLFMIALIIGVLLLMFFLVEHKSVKIISALLIGVVGIVSFSVFSEAFVPVFLLTIGGLLAFYSVFKLRE